MTKISYFNSGEFSKVGGDVELDDYLEYVRDGRWQDKVLAVRNGKSDKTGVPSVTVSGRFEDRRRRDNLAEHSGIIGIDLDAEDNADLLANRARLEQDPHCYACHTSIRGFGLVWYVKVSPEKHLEAFQAIERYLANQYGVVVDPSGKDVSRLRFISYDPHLYLNRGSKKWSKYLNKKQREFREAPARAIAYHDEDIRHILEQIQNRGVNIAEDYHSWLHTSFALASEFGEGGRDYFHIVSAQSSKYERGKCDKQYDIALRRDHTGGVGIGTFFYYCQQAGIETRTPATIEAEIYYAQRLKSEPGIDRKEAIRSTEEYLQMRGVEPERTREALEKIKDIPVHQFQTVQVNDKVLELETFIKSLGLRFNEITRYYESGEGEQLEDRDYNSLYRKAMHAVGFNVSQSKLFALMDSDLITSYNPFTSFFRDNKHLKPTGCLEELLACFDYEKPDLDGVALTEDEEAADYLEVFLTRWLLGIISAMNGTFSLLVLVLTGEQGTGKTKFFRNLLPESLSSYQTENKLNKENDIAPLMTKKLIICDDEFSGKNKRQADEFKELVSKEKFSVRKPYGKVWEDLTRYAVLCGTSNDDRVLYDMTGNRRIIPVKIRSIDHDRMAEIDKTELFMELYWMWRDLGDKWMLGKKERIYLNKCTGIHESENFEMDMVQKYFEPTDSLGGNCIPRTTTEIKIYLDEKTKERLIIHKLGAALKALGFEKRSVRDGGTTSKKWLVIEKYTSAPNVVDESPTTNLDSQTLDF
ncbi:VapE domain-containing protein [Robiginitalea biformata]|uniref:Uncharacterized protein n=1 Tax=Robiginitalea biformata (strain ATCC BAA-864 / DSM 15991 / KCTC 12146 / HTCC2501) TaxID=313596 RepID=A4CPW0_ROBBH|nr:VapE domain-containing protein [Robiginitalea biformata]EAR14045.1 hypothetical protein RB2501_01425 [Robiginitalea biformata HTCC2501]